MGADTEPKHLEMEYHPKELGLTSTNSVTIWTGLRGVFLLFAALGGSLGAFVFGAPFVLLGMAEVVAYGPTNWRIRFIRKESA